jgi:hypothetical protein
VSGDCNETVSPPRVALPATEAVRSANDESASGGKVVARVNVSSLFVTQLIDALSAYGRSTGRRRRDVRDDDDVLDPAAGARDDLAVALLVRAGDKRGRGQSTPLETFLEQHGVGVAELEAEPGAEGG